MAGPNDKGSPHVAGYTFCECETCFAIIVGVAGDDCHDCHEDGECTEQGACDNDTFAAERDREGRWLEACKDGGL